MQTKIDARKIHICLGSNDVGDAELGGRIDAFALRRGIDNVLLTADGNLLMDRAKKIMLNSGVRTIQTALELQDLPTRVTTFTPLPSSFLAHFFADGYDEQRIVYIRGSRFTKERIEDDIRCYVGNSKNRNRNRKILEMSTCELLEDGTIAAENFRSINDTKKLYAELTREENLNDDLEQGECHRIEYREWTKDVVADEYRVAYPEREPYIVDIKSHKELFDYKQKHYWIYSHGPNYGKSHSLDVLKKKYNAHDVGDMNNWMGVSEAAQFLVFDEYGCSDKRKMTVESLKSLTGGRASSTRTNCKSYGSSYQPRDDVQVVISSNYSPFEVYGKYDAKTGQRYIDMDVLSQLEQRFNVHRLDGPVEEDRIRFMKPSNWTDTQFAAQLGRVFEPLRDNDIYCLTTRQAIPYVFGLIRQARHLLHARCGQTTTDLFALRLDALPIFLPSLKSSLGNIARALYNSRGREKTGMSWEASLELLIEDEDALRDTPRSHCLDEFIETKQHRLIKDAAFTHYVKANRRYFYDGVFAATLGDVDVNDMYSPEVLRQMLAEFDSHFGPELFATRQIYDFVKVVLEEFFNADQSRVTEMEKQIQRISAAVHDRRVNGVRNVDDEDGLPEAKRPRHC